MRVAWSLVVLVLAGGVLAQQETPLASDVKALAAAGKVEHNTYSNSHAGFSIRLPQPPCDAKLNTNLAPQSGRALLLQCGHSAQGSGTMYTFTVFTETWAHYPSLQSVEQYVRSLRLVGERDPGTKTVQIETPRQMAGLDFSEVILSSQAPPRTYYQGITCAHFNAYLLCFKAQAPTVDAVRGLLDLRGKLAIAGSRH